MSINHAEMAPLNDVFLRRKTVEEITALKKSTIYRLISQGMFPAPIKLTAFAVGWRRSEIKKWMADRPVAIEVISK